MVTEPEPDEDTALVEVRVDAERILDRHTSIEHGKITGADRDGDEVVFTVEEPVGTCPQCGYESKGTTAWSSVHDRQFACKDQSCPVSKFYDPLKEQDDG